MQNRPKPVRRLGLTLTVGPVLILVVSACAGGSTVVVGPTPTAPAGAATATATPIAASPTPRPSLQAQVITQVLSNIAPGTNSQIADFSCPSGYVVAGGGVNSGYSSIVPMENAPIGAATWRAEIFNTSSSQTFSVQVQVDCLRATGATLSSQIVTRGLGTIAVGSTGTAEASCPAGYVVAGGGFNSGYPTFNVVWNAPISSTTWQAEVYNTGAASITLQVQVVCLSATGLNAHVVSASLGNAAPNGNSAIVDTHCPPGSFVGGGGLNANGNYTFTEMWDAPIDTHTWRSEVFNGNPYHSLVAQTRFVCLSLS
jgi:hypothetical protein